MNDMDFDWVTARAKCSPETVLRALEVQVEADTKKRNSLRIPIELQYGVEFFFNRVSSAFTVTAMQTLGGSNRTGMAIFGATSEGVQVSYRDITHSDLIGKLTLDNNGECRLRVDGFADPLSFWQFRKIALEPIFFDCVSGLRL